MKLLQIAAEVAAPLTKTKEVLIVGGGDDRTTSEVARLAAQLPPTLQMLTGIDLTKVVQKAIAVQQR